MVSESTRGQESERAREGGGRGRRDGRPTLGGRREGRQEGEAGGEAELDSLRASTPHERELRIRRRRILLVAIGNTVGLLVTVGLLG